MTRLHLCLLLLFAALHAGAVHQGTASKDESVILLWTGSGIAGSGVLLSPKVAITVSHVLSGESAPAYRFTTAADGRVPSQIPENQVGHFKEGKTLALRPIYASRDRRLGARQESVTLLLVEEKDRKKFARVSFPKLPRAGHVPGKTLEAVGYGETHWPADGTHPVRWMRNEGKVAPLETYPNAPYLFETKRIVDKNQLTAGGDSGGALRDGDLLLGLHEIVLTVPPDHPSLSPADRAFAGTAFFLAEPKLRAEIDSVLKSWKITLP
jgi:hypothetical protein